jgi:hypothetical protein
MPLPLPNLDDRRWADLVSEGTSLVPLYAPGWTDWNVHDPGITLIELFAWVAEMDLYWANRIPAERVRKLLALVGITPRPPRAARTVAAFTLAAGPLPAGLPLDLPADLEVAGDDPGGVRTVFRTLAPVALSGAALAAVQVAAAGEAQVPADWTARFRRGEPVPLLGDDPASGAAFYLGLAMPPGEALPAGRPLSFYLTFAGSPPGSSDRAARERLLEAARLAAATPCPAPGGRCGCAPAASRDSAVQPAPAQPDPAPALPPHASVRTVWEIAIMGAGAGAGGAGIVWRPLDPAAGEILDDTRCLTLDGSVVVTPPAGLASQRLGAVEDELFYLRCRFVAGAYDAAPALAALAVDGVLAEQAETLPELQYPMGGATADGPVQATFLGAGSGEPSQRLAFPKAPILAATLEVWTLEGTRLRPWQVRPDFDASSRADSHLMVDLEQGLLIAGDGEAGRTLPENATVLARYRATRGAAGNLPAGRLAGIADTPHNQALLGAADATAWKALLATLGAGIAVANPLPAAGGAAAEALAAATARAVDLAGGSERAITLADYEALAAATPGVALARVTARANLDPAFPCLAALGVVTVIVLPFLPRNRPQPSAGLLRAVAAHLGRRRLVGTRVVVSGPDYLEVAVRATVRALPRSDRTAVAARVAAALDAFFHPLTGGPAGDGWPFGRDVYRAEVLRVIAAVPGVDVVLSLALVLPDGSERCGNLCLAPLELVAAGRHAIQVE